MALTRSKAAAQQATPPQKTIEIEEDLVTINWIFFDKSDPDECEPFPIDVPRSLFNGVKKTEKLFTSEILECLSLSICQNIGR